MAKKDIIPHEKKKGSEMVFRSLSLPGALIEDLKLLRDCYEKTWYKEGERKRVTYEKVFERLLSKSGLGHVDPDVFEQFIMAMKNRPESPKVMKRKTRKRVKKIATTTKEKGTLLKEEVAKEQARTEASPDAMITKKTEKRFVHPDGRQYKAIRGNLTPFYAMIPERGSVGQNTLFKEGFELKDIVINDQK